MYIYIFGKVGKIVILVGEKWQF